MHRSLYVSHCPGGVISFRSDPLEFVGWVWHDPNECWPPDLTNPWIESPEHEKMYKEARRAVGRRGLFGRSWPITCGGEDLSALYDFIVFDELARAGIPPHFQAGILVAPLIIRHGSEQQKTEFLPLIKRGEIDFALGYSEPGAGTDLASLITRAERVGDEWVINGVKLWTSSAEMHDYCLLAARTGHDGARHEGISLFIIKIPIRGFSANQIATLSERTYETVWTDVRVPASALLGDEGAGWTYMVEALNIERSLVTPPATIERSFAKLVSAVIGMPVDHLAESEDVAYFRLAHLQTQIAAAFAIARRLCWAASFGDPTLGEAGLFKVIMTELRQRIAMEAQLLLGVPSIIRRGQLERPAGGHFEQEYRNTFVWTFGGGTNDVMRAHIAREVCTGGIGTHATESRIALMTPEQRELDSTQDEVLTTVRGVLENVSSLDQKRKVYLQSEPDLNEEAARALLDLDLHLLGIPERVGGLGGPWQLTAAALEAIGAALGPVAFPETMAAMHFFAEFEETTPELTEVTRAASTLVVLPPRGLTATDVRGGAAVLRGCTVVVSG